MQIDLDSYLHIYNYERAHQGKNMNGKTPLQAFLEGLPDKQIKHLTFGFIRDCQGFTMLGYL